MHFDALTLAAVAAELNQTLQGGRVQQVVLPDERSVGMEIYAGRERRYLLLSAHPQASRIHLVDQRLRRGVDNPTPLLLLLRKYVRGATLDSIEQPIAFERVLFLHFDHPEHGISILAVEPMGRLSNLLLLDGGKTILGVLNPVPPGDRAARVLLPKRPYVFPPFQEKSPPLDDGTANYRERLLLALRGQERLWRALLDSVAGVSPTQAREIAWRAVEDTDARVQDVDLDHVVDALHALWAPIHTDATWQPGLAVDDEGTIAGYAAYELHFLGDFLPTPDISAAIAAFHQEKERDTAGSQDAYAGVRNSVAALLKDAKQRISRQLEALAQDEPEPGEPERIRTRAEWLLALSSQIEPGQTELVVPQEEGDLTIQLDERLTPVEQAERLFDRATKQARAARIIPARRAQLQADLDFIHQLESDLALAENQPEIVAVREELRGAGYLRKRRKRQQRTTPDRSQPMRFLSQEGFPILVGRNARQNEIVTFDQANADDLWLHIRDLPGAHVVVRSGGQTVSDDSIQAAAQLAAYFSSQRGETTVPVAVTRRRFVTRMPGGHRGQVHYRNEETITVPARMPDL